MPRPRTIDDSLVLEAAAALIGRVGPASVTLQGVADEVGLSAATLVQRFGSKRELLLAVARRGSGAAAEPLAAARADHASPLDALAAGLVATVATIDTPATLANHLAFLQMDLQDPDFHALALADARERRTAIADLLDEAVAAGELHRGTKTDVLAGLVQTTFNGAMVTWAVYAEGSLESFLREQLRVLLAPYRRA